MQILFLAPASYPIVRVVERIPAQGSRGAALSWAVEEIGSVLQTMAHFSRSTAELKKYRPFLLFFHSDLVLIGA